MADISTCSKQLTSKCPALPNQVRVVSEPIARRELDDHFAPIAPKILILTHKNAKEYYKNLKFRISCRLESSFQMHWAAFGSVLDGLELRQEVGFLLLNHFLHFFYDLKRRLILKR